MCKLHSRVGRLSRKFRDLSQRSPLQMNHLIESELARIEDARQCDSIRKLEERLAELRAAPVGFLVSTDGYRPSC